MKHKIPLLYVLHSGALYGTERMAIATSLALSDSYSPLIIAPPGEALDYARGQGVPAHSFSSLWELSRILVGFLSFHSELVYFATGVTHSLLLMAANSTFRRKVAHVHVVHGGADERLSYGRKRILNRTDIWFVAVSQFVKDRLVHHRVRKDRIEVIENFLPQQWAKLPEAAVLPENPSVGRAIVVSRLDPIKRVDLLLDALDMCPALSALKIRIFGTGSEMDNLTARAAAGNPNVEFCGFRSDISEELAKADLLIHLCPEEPFGLAIIEAMASGVPVLVADTGGAALLAENGVSGFHFRANDPRALAQKIQHILELDKNSLKTIMGNARLIAATRFSEKSIAQRYRTLIGGLLN